MRKTAFTPRTASAAASSTVRSFAPKTGGRAITAVNRPGSCTSMPKSCRPLLLARASSRVVGRPIRRKSFGSFSAIVSGTGSAIAAVASSP